MLSNFKIKQLITKIHKNLRIFNRNKKKFRTLMYHSVSNSLFEQENKDIYRLDFLLFKSQIEYLIEIENYDFFSTQILKGEIPNNGVALTFDDGYFDNFSLVAPYLLEKKIPFTVFVITNYIKNNKNGFMSEKNLKDLSNNSLITIGSHTCNHKDLTKLHTEEVLNELIESKSYLENLLGKEVYSMSYPFGKYNNFIKQKVLEAGYKLAFSSKFYFNSDSQDKLSLCRNEIWNSDNLEHFDDKLKGNWDWLRYIKK